MRMDGRKEEEGIYTYMCIPKHIFLPKRNGRRRRKMPPTSRPFSSHGHFDAILLHSTIASAHNTAVTGGDDNSTFTGPDVFASLCVDRSFAASFQISKEEEEYKNFQKASPMAPRTSIPHLLLMG